MPSEWALEQRKIQPKAHHPEGHGMSLRRHMGGQARASKRERARKGVTPWAKRRAFRG